MNKHWKYTSSLRSYSSAKSLIQLSPARKRFFDPYPKRKIYISSSVRKHKPKLVSPLSDSSNKSPTPLSIRDKSFFTPKTKHYIELSPNPLPYDLRGRGIQSDMNSIKVLLNNERPLQISKKLKEEYKKLTKKSIRKVEHDREELQSLDIELKNHHLKANEYFFEIKSGNKERVLQLLAEFPELIKEVDSTGQTGLHWAVRRQNLAIIRILVSANANPLAMDIVGRRAEDIARNKGLFEIADVLGAARRRTAYASKTILNAENSAFATLNQFKATRSKSRLKFYE